MTRITNFHWLCVCTSQWGCTRADNWHFQSSKLPPRAVKVSDWRWPVYRWGFSPTMLFSSSCNADIFFPKKKKPKKPEQQTKNPCSKLPNYIPEQVKTAANSLAGQLKWSLSSPLEVECTDVRYSRTAPKSSPKVAWFFHSYHCQQLPQL